MIGSSLISCRNKQLILRRISVFLVWLNQELQYSKLQSSVSLFHKTCLISDGIIGDVFDL
jgi:hypothetical protein